MIISFILLVYYSYSLEDTLTVPGTNHVIVTNNELNTSYRCKNVNFLKRNKTWLEPSNIITRVVVL